MPKSHSIEETNPQSLNATPTPKRPITAAILSCLLIYFDIWFPSYVDNWSNIDYSWLFSANFGLAIEIYGIYLSWDFSEDGEEVDSSREITAAILAFLLDAFGLWALTWDVKWNVGAWVGLVCVMVGMVIGVRAGQELMRQANVSAATIETSEKM